MSASTDGGGPLTTRHGDTLSQLNELLLERDTADPIETFLQNWAPLYYGLDGRLGKIDATAWPILGELTPNVKKKAELAAVTTYKVNGHNVSHAFIYCEDKTSYYVGSSPKFGEIATPGSPRQISELNDKLVVAIVLGPNKDYPNAYMHISDGTIWCSGDCECGQLGDGTSGKKLYRTEFKKVPDLRNIVAFHCGSCACTAMDVHQNVFAFGINTFGKIAAPQIGGKYPKPHKIEMKDVKPILIACGFAHTFVVTSDGKIYSHGANDHYQLGRICGNYSCIPCPIPNYEENAVEKARIMPVPNQCYQVVSGKCKRSSGIFTSCSQKIVCGSAHTLCLLKSGKLTGWGNNQDGQIGVGHQLPVEKPTDINFDGGIVVDVLAVHNTTVAITEDGCKYVCGSYDGKDVTKPGNVRAENARDLFMMGLYPSTGGCARLVWGRRLQNYKRHLKEAIQHFEEEKASHDETQRKLEKEIKSHDKTKTEHNSAKEEIRVQRERLAEMKQQAIQQLAKESEFHEKTRWLLRQERESHNETKVECDRTKTELKVQRERLAAMTSQARQQLAKEIESHEKTRQLLQQERKSRDKTKNEHHRILTELKVQSEKLLEVTDQEAQARQQFEKEEESHQATRQLLQQERESHDETRSEHVRAVKELEMQRGLELAHHEEQSRQQIKKERISHEATHQLLQQEIESHNRTKSEHDKAEQELQEQRKKLIELKHHEQQACEQFEKEKTSHDTARQLHQEEKESHNRTKIENNRIKKLLKDRTENLHEVMQHGAETTKKLGIEKMSHGTTRQLLTSERKLHEKTRILYDKGQSDLSDKQEENQHLKTEIKKLLEDLFEAKTKNNALHEVFSASEMRMQEDIAKLNRELGESRVRENTLQTEVKDFTEKIHTLESDKARLDKEHIHDVSPTNIPRDAMKCSDEMALLHTSHRTNEHIGAMSAVRHCQDYNTVDRHDVQVSVLQRHQLHIAQVKGQHVVWENDGPDPSTPIPGDNVKLPSAGSFSGHHALRRDEEDAIIKHFSLLANNMPNQVVLDFMLQERVVDIADYGKICDLTSQYDMGQAILKALLKHPKGYSTLLKALDVPNSGGNWLAERLRE